MGSVLVTGGSRGIGRGIVLAAAARGYDVIFSYQNQQARADEVVAEATALGAKVEAVRADMGDPDSVRALGAHAAAVDDLELLINNAGVGMEDTLADTVPDRWAAALAINLTAPMLLSQALADRLTATSGSIVNVSSSGGVVGSLHGPAYGSTKAGIIGLTMTLARELAPHVRVNAIAPGPVDTELWASLPEDQKTPVIDETPLNRVASVEEMARVCLDLAEWTYVTGIVVVADGGRTMR